MNTNDRENFGQNEPYSQDEKRFKADDKSAPLDNSVTNDENQVLNRELSDESNDFENEDLDEDNLHNDFDTDNDVDGEKNENDTDDPYFQKNSNIAQDLDEDLKNG